MAFGLWGLLLAVQGKEPCKFCLSWTNADVFNLPDPGHDVRQEPLSAKIEVSASCRLPTRRQRSPWPPGVHAYAGQHTKSRSGWPWRSFRLSWMRMREVLPPVDDSGMIRLSGGNGLVGDT